MIFDRDEYSINYPPGADVAVLRGVMRLATPAAYDSIFAPLSTRLAEGEALTVDVTDVTFMNSSGIRALATLVLTAKERGSTLRLIASARVPWQKKTAASLAAVNKALVVELR
jgi:hypothetical protein